MRIMIVEDEEALATGLKFNFEQEGYEVELFGDGPAALERFRDQERPFDVVVLDLMLPSMSGYEICIRIRELDRQIPILVLSARTLSEDRTRAFDCGTDQYMTKPFALPELLSRVRNLIERRRALPRTVERRGLYEFGNVTVDFDRFQVKVGEETHTLTTMEMQLLRFFIENEGKVLARLDILEHVWGPESDVTVRTIDNFVMRLRRIMEPDPAQPRHFLSLRGTGYRFTARP